MKIKPHISCIMPTGNRNRFVVNASVNFLTQRTEWDTELIIVDDGDVPSEFMLNDRIKYVYLPGRPRLSTGEKRNIAARLATAPIVMHWDDDDWYAPTRIQDQMHFHLCSRKAVSGYHSLLYYREHDGATFQYDDPGFRPHIAGTSLCYEKEFWLKHPFHDRQVGEDFVFTVEARRNDELASKDGREFVVARIHDSNTCQPKFGEGKFQSVPFGRLPFDFLLTLGPVQAHPNSIA